MPFTRRPSVCPECRPMHSQTRTEHERFLIDGAEGSGGGEDVDNVDGNKVHRLRGARFTIENRASIDSTFIENRK